MVHRAGGGIWRMRQWRLPSYLLRVFVVGIAHSEESALDSIVLSAERGASNEAEVIFAIQPRA